ncbi:MAG: hypothetical protein RI884_2045 [Pseudomonadota bacterium]
MTAPTPVRRAPYIYIACPWTPVGGGMFKVADYLIQSQSSGHETSHQSAQLRPLDTRGARGAAWSLAVLTSALYRLVRGRLDGRLAGVHVNMAERLSLVRKSVVVATCHALGLPVTLHLHAAQLHRAWPDLPAPARALVRRVFALPACCIVLGRESADFVQRELKVPASRIEVVINGVPEPSHRAPAPREAGSDPLRLLFVGNLSARKGVPELLRALALSPLAAMPLQLTLAGGGDLQTFRAIATAMGLGDRVRFEGWAPQARVAQLMSESDLLVLPSHDEGLPLVILEALACGVPVVCTPVGEIPHVLQDGVHARFVAPGDVTGLARTLASLLADRSQREALAHHGRALYQATFSLPRFFDQIAAIHARHFGVAGRRLPAPAATYEAAAPQETPA